MARIALPLCLLVMLAGSVAAQTVPPYPPKGVRPAAQVPPRPAEAEESMRPGSGGTSEKSLAVEPNVNIKICVLEGSLKINGWARSELRVFIKNGTRASLRVLEKSPASGKPVWVLISKSYDENAASPQQSECISGERIEIDVPVKASLNVLGRATETAIDSVDKAFVKNIEGNISLRGISGGITAVTYQGDVEVENSGGSISLESSTGNIVGYEVGPGQIGDVFKAKTNSGAISLQKVEHRQIEANSISGTVVFNGRFLPGGQYSFKTSNGAIRLLIPPESSCRIIASYGFGEFESEIPLKYLTNDNSSSGKSLVATMGGGDAAVRITTSSGRIGIRAQ